MQHLEQTMMYGWLKQKNRTLGLHLKQNVGKLLHKNQQQIEQGAELIQVQKQVMNEVKETKTEVKELKDTLKQTNVTLHNCLSAIHEQLKRGNDMHAQVISLQSTCSNSYDNNFDESLPVIFQHFSSRSI